MIKVNIRILILLFLISLQSCGVFKSVFKQSDKDKKSIEMNVSKETDSTIEDKTKTIITEKAKIVVDVPSKQIETNTPVLDLLAIQNLILVRDNLVEVRQTYDTLSKNLKTTVYLKSFKIPINIDKTTIINNDIVTNSKSKLDSNSKSNTIIKQKIEKQKPINAIWFVVLGLGVLAVVYFLSKKLF